MKIKTTVSYLAGYSVSQVENLIQRPVGSQEIKSSTIYDVVLGWYLVFVLGIYFDLLEF